MKENNQKLKILKSICEEIGIPNLIDVLSYTSFRRLKPVLINAWKNRVAIKTPANLLSEYEEKKQFYSVSSITQDKLYDFMQACFTAIPLYFDIVEMSPIVPLGTNSVLSRVSQNNSLSTIRGSEVVSDTTTQLALECAVQRKKLLASSLSLMQSVCLCSSQRVLRLQPFDSNKGYMQHFNLFGLCSGGRNSKSEAFAIKWIRTHISIILDILKSLKKFGLDFANITVSISDIKFLEQLISSLSIPRNEVIQHSLDENYDFFKRFNVKFPREIETISDVSVHDFEYCGLPDKIAYFSCLEEDIINPLRQRYPHVRFCFDFSRKAGMGYYQHICFHIFGTDRVGRCIQIADGGTVNWLGKLLKNRKEAMVISGIGSELVQKLFSSSEVEC